MLGKGPRVRFQSKLLPVCLAILSVAATAAYSDNMAEGFELWTQQTTYGNYTNLPWSVNSAAIRGFPPPPPYYAAHDGSSQACWLNRWVDSTNSWTMVALTNGAGVVSFWVKSAGGSNDFVIEKSPDGASSWTPLTNGYYTSATWGQIEYDVQEHGTFHLRIRKTGDNAHSTAYLGIDDIAITNPASEVIISNLENDPDPVFIGNAVDIQCELTLLGPVSDLAVTSFWKVADGPWTATTMTNAGSIYRTETPIPAQDQVGIPVYYYVKAWFDGYEPLSPVVSATNGYTVQVRAFISDHDTMSVTGDPATDMGLYGDHSWQGIFDPAGSVIDAEFQFSGVHTNGMTNTWGQGKAAYLPFAGTAEFDGPSITISGTNSNLIVFQFNETDLEYEARECFFQDFTGWTTTGFENDTYEGWAVYNALVASDINRQHAGNACYLNSNGMSAVQSPPLPDGAGRFSFWYRNYSQTGSPVAECTIQKSGTGGTNANEWVTIATITDIYGTEYGRFSTSLNDRHLRYIRILNSTNDEHAALCIDDVLIGFAGAGVLISNITVDPEAPTVFEPVTISADIAPRAGASNLVATLYYRSGAAGEFTAVGMTNSGDRFTVTNAIPAGFGDGHGGAGTVEYYIACEFEGYESELASPDFYPEGGGQDPASYTIVPARVLISNVQQSPEPARVGSGVDIEADTALLAGAFDLSMATWYRKGTSGPFTSIAMTETAPSNYVTSSSIPGDSEPGETVQYYIQATFLGPSAASPTNYPPGGAANPTSFIFMAAETVSTYTNMRVTGVFDTDLMLAADHLWQGAATVGQFTDTAFYFEAKNGGTVNWGDAAAPYTVPALFGMAENGAAQISMVGTYSNHFVFQFNETNLEYSAQQAEYINFDDWGAASGEFGVWTNSEGWVISDARTTTLSGDDLERTFGGTGRSCILSTNQNDGSQYVRSPWMDNGVGQFGFRYRNWRGQEEVWPAGFHVQKSVDGTDWITVASQTNVISLDYLYFSMTLSDPGFHYLRVLNSTNTPHDRLCLDELFVAEPGPGPAFSGVTNTPSQPSMIDDVIIEADIASIKSATNFEATVWCRAGSNGTFESIAMTNDSGHFESVLPMPRGWAGTMQYYIECSFDGMYGGERVITHYPPEAGLDPLFYTNSSADNAATDFEEWTQQTVFGTYTNINGWVISDAIIRGFPPPPPYFVQHGGARAGFLNANSPTNSWLRSPFLSNGAGLIAFWAKSAGGLITFALENSTNGTDWVTLEEYSLEEGTWEEYTYFLNDLTPQYVRIRKLADDGEGTAYLGIDDVTISYPPAEVVFSNLQLLPAYPTESGAPQISCEIESGNPFLAAIGISASLHYRTQGQTTYSGPVPMTRSGNTFTTTYGIPAFGAGSLIDYYIEATFNGYASSSREERSPSFYPQGTGGISTNQYFLAPTNTPAAYYVRPQVMAGYQNFDLWTNSTAPTNYTFEGWTLNDALVTNLSANTWHSTPWAAELLNDESYPDSYIQSYVMTNGVGTLSFFARNTTNVEIEIEVELSVDAGPFETFATLTNTSHAAWTRHSFDISTTNNTRIRIHKSGETYEGQRLWIDDIELSYIPTAVAISNIVLHPGYPAAGTAVDVSCEVTPLYNPVQQAGNISVGLYYRNVTRGDTGFTGPLPMLPDGDIYSMLAPIPGTANGSRDLVEYYIKATFTGYSYATEKNSRSPSFYPEGEIGVATNHYYAAPTNSPADYTVRRYASTFGGVTIDLNGDSTEMRLTGDDTWTGQFFVQDTISSALISLNGLEFYDGAEYHDSPFVWGDTNQTRSVLPYIGTMRTNDSAVVVSNMTRGAYIIRFDNESLSYRIERGAFQDFDTWTASPDYFEQNFSQVQILESHPDFDVWNLSTQGEYTEDFETWFVMDTYWPGICPSGEVGYVVSDSQIIRDMKDGTSTSLTCRLSPTPSVGFVQTRPENVADGVGDVTVEYRCLDDTFAPTLYANSGGWDGVMVQAELRATTLPKNGSGTIMGSNTWMSVFARYLDENNYYELRSEQIGVNKKQLILIRKVAGTETRLWSGDARDSSLTQKDTLKLLATTYDGDKVYLEVFRDGGRKKQYWDTGTAITGGGDIGFRASSVDMEVDDVVAGECAEQTFSTWPESSDVSSYTKDEWQVSHAARIAGNAWVELENSAASGLTNHPNLRSPLLTHGLGHVNFSYYKRNGNNSTVMIQWSTNQVDWNTAYTFSISVDNQWRGLDRPSINVTQSNIYVRIVNSTNTVNSRVVLDNIRFEPSPTLAPNWDFTGTADGWTDPEGTWSIANYKYAGAGVSDPLEFKIQTRPSWDEFEPWTTWGTYTNRSNVDYQVESVDVHTGDSLLVRVMHTAGSGSIVLNDVTMTSWKGDNVEWTNDWRISEGWITSDPLRAGRSLQMKLSRKSIGADQCLISPHMTNGVGTISLRNINTLGNQVSFRLETGPSTSSWQTVITVTNNATDWAQPGSYFGWTFNTNSSMYVRILNTSTNPEASLMIDDVSITDFSEIDDYSWRAYNALITSSEEDRLLDTPWNVNGAYLNSNAVDNVHPAQAPLDEDMPYIQSGFLEGGVGDITFWHRSWDAMSQPTLLIKIAPTADTPSGNWKTIATLSNITNQTFAFYSHAIYNSSNHFVRFYCDTTADEYGRICLEDILITAPFGSEVYMRDLRLEPEIPLHTTPVHVLADVTERFLQPSNIVLTAYYRTGSGNWGTWTSLNPHPMEAVSSNGTIVTYKTVSPIPSMAVDMLVQYYVSATYDGLFSEVTSPKEHREFDNPEWYFPVDLNEGVADTNPYYYVFSCLPGDVWINEINLVDDTSPTQYVELVGLANIDIGGWKVEVLDTDFEKHGWYSIAGGTVLPSEHEGYGFWVLGESSMVSVADMYLTNPIPELGAIRLYRIMGAIEDGVCFGDSVKARGMDDDSTNHLRYIGWDDDWENSPLDIEGTGSNRSDFASGEWGQLNSYTPGAVNENQTLVDRNTPPQVVITITDLWLTDTNVWLTFTCNHTNEIEPTPWYSTNLMITNGWLEGTGASNTYSDGGIYTQRFDRLVGPIFFYRVIGSW